MIGTSRFFMSQPRKLKPVQMGAKQSVLIIHYADEKNEDESRPRVSTIEAYNVLQIIKTYAMDSFDHKHPSLYTLNAVESELETIRLKRKKQILLMS
ncbi:hypothetical protein P9112_005920 [Eukaryota sp. TZLM1-RC]